MLLLFSYPFWGVTPDFEYLEGNAENQLQDVVVVVVGGSERVVVVVSKANITEWY